MKNNIILSLKEVSKSFSGNKAVDNVSIDIERGKITGLIGANGAGKTTLFNCLTGNYHPNSGSIIYKDRRIEKLEPYKICRLGIARTFQIARPFGSLTVLENAAIGAFSKCKTKKEALIKAQEIIEITGLSSKRDVTANQLNTGDQRRLELAHALSTDPELLLLDEVMAGLTPGEAEEVITLIKKVNSMGVTILMIEHIMQTIMCSIG